MTAPDSPVALISGATSGIGLAIARRLAESGYRVILTGRRAERLEAIAAEFTEAHLIAHTAVLDVRDNAAVEAFVTSLPPEWAELDVLVNNAGLARGMAPLDSGVLSDWDEMIDTNLKGLLYLTRAVAPGMRARRRGHIVNVGSTAAKEMYPMGNVYSATKHAVDAITRGLRMDMVGSGVRVGAVHPGFVETEFSNVRFHGDDARAKKVYDGFQPLTGEDVAEVVRFMVMAPAHINVADVVVMPTAQASVMVVDRRLPA
jgi:3-hydroxy acid dehydrogenase / malonic semialdehyde reductase